MMKGFKKSPLGLKTDTFVRKYDAFQFADRLKKNGAFPVEYVNNCDLSDGNAHAGIGVTDYVLPSGRSVAYDWSLSAPKAFFFCGGKLGFLSDKNKLYFYNESTRSYDLAHTFNGEMKVVQAQDDAGTYHLYFCGEAGLFTCADDQEMVQISAHAYFPAACVFQGRIFTAVADSIVYGAPFSLGDVSESMDGGGKIVLPFDSGNIVDIVASSECVFVFCQYGVWKLSVAGSARDFRLERVPFHGNEILKGSACVVAYSGGEKILFFDKYGPWKLDRSGVSEICRDVRYSPRTNDQSCEHAYVNGKVVYNYRTVVGWVYNVVIDAETDSAYPSFTAEGLCNLKGQAVAVVDGTLKALQIDSPLPSHRLSELVARECDFNVSGVKTLRRLRVLGEGTITLSVSGAGKVQTFSLHMQDGEARVDVRLKSEFFRLRFTLGERAIVRGLDVQLCQLKGVQ